MLHLWNKPHIQIPTMFWVVCLANVVEGLLTPSYSLVQNQKVMPFHQDLCQFGEWQPMPQHQSNLVQCPHVFLEW